MNTKLLFICLVFALPLYGQSYSVTVGDNKAPKDTAVHHKHIKPSFTIGGSVGCNIPTEAYGFLSNYVNSSIYYQPGYADPGPYFDVNLECHLGKHFGLMAKVTGSINPLDKKFYDPSTGTSGTGGTYYGGTALVGPCYSTTFKNGNVFEANFLMGYMELYQAQIVYTSIEGEVIPAYPGSGFSAELGAKFKFHITKGTFITVNATYTEAFSNTIYYTPFTWVIEATNESLGMLNTGIGVEFKL